MLESGLSRGHSQAAGIGAGVANGTVHWQEVGLTLADNAGQRHKRQECVMMLRVIIG